MAEDGVLRPTRNEPAAFWLRDDTIEDADWSGAADAGGGARAAADPVRYHGGATAPEPVAVSAPPWVAAIKIPVIAAPGVALATEVDAGSRAPILSAVPAAAAFAATPGVEISVGSLQIAPAPASTDAVAAGMAITNGVGDVSAQQIAALLTNLQSTLDLIESGLEQKAFAESLPLIGNQLAAAFSQGQMALQAFKTLDGRIIAALTTLESTGTSVPLSVVQSTLNAAIKAAGFSGNASTSLDAGSGNLSVIFASTDALPAFSVPLGTNFGIPGLNFATQGAAQAALTYGVDLTADVAQGGAFTISAPAGAVTLGLDITAPNFVGDADFGPLRVIAKDHNSSLSGTIALTTNGVATLSGNASIDVNLTSDLGTAALPSISTELTANWGFNPSSSGQDDTLDPSNETKLGSTPTIALNNVTVGMGTFVTNLVKPVLDDLEQVIKPIQPILDLLNAPIGPIMALPKVVWQQLDYNKDNTVNLLDFIDKDAGGTDSALDKVVGLFNEVNTLESYFQNASAGGIQFSLGDLDIPTSQDIRANGFDISSVMPTESGREPLAALLSAANALDPSGALGSNLNTLLTPPSTSDPGGFSFPILDSPASAAALLFGGNAKLVQFQLPEAMVGWGTVESNGTVTNASTLFDFPVFTGVDLIAVGALVGQFGLDFGLDTTGLTAFAKDGYNDPSLILDGLYAANPTLDGVQVPMATFGGEIGLGVSAGIPGTDASGTGDITGVLNIGLAHGGTEYLGNLINLLNTNPLGLFDVTGRITAGLDFNINVLDQSVFGIHSPRVVLYPPAGQGASANNLPTITTWGTFAGADFETASNWSPTFAPVSDGTLNGTWDLYADCTIDIVAQIGPIESMQPASDYFVTFNGPLEADLYSLQLAVGSTLLVQSGTLLIDGSSQVSTIAGYLGVATGGDLLLSGVVDNTGGIGIDGGEIGVPGVLDLTGAGMITGSGAGALWLPSLVPGISVASLLRNDDNTIDGIGIIDVQFENHGAVVADAPGHLVLDHSLHNAGVLAAGPKPHQLVQITQGTLEIQSDLETLGSLDVVNTGGTITAGAGGNVFIGAGNVSGNGLVVEIHGGTLSTPHVAGVPDGTITLRNVVTLDGGTVGMTVDALLALGTFSAGASLLTLVGLIEAPTYGSAPGANGFASNGSNIDLFDATIRGGVLDGRVPTGSLAGIIQVEISATLDGSAGVAGVGIDGTLHLGSDLGSGQTLALGGGIVSAVDGGAIDMGGGTIVAGILGADTASLGAAIGGPQGTLLMDGTTSSIVPRDTASVLNNSWLITGVGGVAGGLTNAASGTIAAVGGFLGIGSFAQPSANQGLIVATTLGVITIDSELDNAGGTLRADGGTILLRTYAVDGGVLETPNGGTIDLLFNETLSGVAAALTLAAGSHIVLGADQAITGSIVNRTTLALDGDSATSVIKTLHISGEATLSGGGSLLMSDAGGGGGVSTQVITGSSINDLLDNVDNTISGYGVIGFGAFGLINEAAGTILASGGTLTIGANFTNAGVVAATAGSTLELNGAVIDGGDVVPAGGLVLNLINAGKTLLADAGTIVFGGSIAGGTLDARNGGQILANSGTLDGRASAVTIPGTVTVSAPATLPANGNNTLVLEGTIANAGTIAVQADSSQANNQRAILIAGTATLIAGGLVSMTDLSPPGAAIALLGSSAGDTLDNVDNRIVGVGRFGENQLSLTNEAAGVIEANGGLLVLQASGTAVNQGTLAAIGGTLDALGVIANAGGSIEALSDGLVLSNGLVQLDGVTVQGGRLASDATSMLADTSNGATLDGTASAVTLAALSNAQVISGSTLALRGTLVDQGSITATGAVASAVAVLVSGTVAVQGVGTIALVDATGLGNDATQVFSGHTTTDELDNGAVIRGVGQLGDNAMTLVNDTGGTVSADGGTLMVKTGSIAITNRGLMTAAPTGILAIFNNVENVGGTIAAAGSGISRLEQITVTGGSFAGDGSGQVLANVATIDGRASTVTLAAGAQVGVVPQYSNSLALEGNFANSGTLFVAGVSSIYKSSLIIDGTARLTGGGRMQLIDNAAAPGFGDSFVVGIDGIVPNAYASNTLDNVDNTISGTGRLGNAELAITNEAAGVISAVGGALSLITASSNSIPTQGGVVNRGTMQAFGSVLYINAVVDNRGGVVQALSDGAGHSGTVDLNGAAFQGGTFLSDTTDPASFILADSYGGTLDGIAQAVTLGAGEPLRVLPHGSLALSGAIVNLGTLIVQANSTPGEFATVQIAGTVHLSGGGRIAMSNLSGGNSDQIQGSSGADVLDNIDNTIIGNGDIGRDSTSLTNEAAGLIAAQGGTLRFDPSGPGTSVANRGLLEALGGTLDLLAIVDNAGGTIAARNDGAGHSGVVLLTGADIEGGVVAGDSTDAGSQILIGANSTLDGSQGALTLDAASHLEIDAGKTLHLLGSIFEHGSALLNSDTVFGDAMLEVDGSVVLGGGGTIDFALPDGTGEQIIDGGASGDNLENTDVTITGAGHLGMNELGIVNDAAGVVRADGGTLVIPGGLATVTNHGLLDAAVGAVLDLSSNIANAGGTIGGGGGSVLLDNAGTVVGGTFAGQIFSYDETVEGGVTIAAGATLGVSSSFPNPYAKALTLEGGVVNHGTLLVQGSDTAAAIPGILTVAGTVSLSGGGEIVLVGTGSGDLGTQNQVKGAAAGAVLDDIDNLVVGYGTLGVGAMPVIDEAAASIRAQGGTLDVAGPVTGTGTLAISDASTLRLDGSIAASLTIDFLPGGGNEILSLAAPLAAGIAIQHFAATGGIVSGIAGPLLDGTTIEHFATTDVISFPGIFSTITPSVAGNIVTLSSGGTTIASFILAGNDAANHVSVTDSGGIVTLTTSVACYAAGTRILTMAGEIAVEALREGDVVATCSGRLRPIRWIGVRNTDCARHPSPAEVMPVRVSAHAFGPGMPHRDLLLSPDHAVFTDGVLIPVRYLVNGSSIVQEHAETVTYFHVELASHDVIVADGLPCETYLDTGNRGALANGGVIAHGHPDFAVRIWDSDACAASVAEG